MDNDRPKKIISFISLALGLLFIFFILYTIILTSRLATKSQDVKKIYAGDDNSAPLVTLVAPKDKATVGSLPLLISVVALDPSGIRSIDIFFDSFYLKECKTTSICNITLPADLVGTGKHMIKGQATDNSPNQNTSQAIITFTK